MSAQPKHITALELGIPAREELPDNFQKYFNVCDEKLGMVPNVLKAYSHRPDQLDVFSRIYNELMFGESGVTKLEKEMIAVAVSASNSCYYCQVAHGAAVRGYSGDPTLGELMVMNYRAAELSERQRAMLDFAVKLTESPEAMIEADRQALRDVGFSDRDIWDIANVAGFYNMTNRVASAVDMQPNLEYHTQNRS
ncbi:MULTISPECIES: peroxidase-related enzyme [unclassified Marinobacterium]|uniref:peroxidase-related enzyme n=1 Tax=unclassified Marinobacterium TaxID=2644139 RepID=UPI00156A63CB|nr:MULTISPECIES: peroxidase-related enzyme [unclassified Marinobacterium]NRP10647.1 Carboxymuconolactone decarboxylase family protein [Marinobacterium sp. xm-g-48]NRP46767.1 Carboxymuconolactone decarboxylase family protein [Marinobacterium sp. xm-d-543]NRP83649.1 Carboxymuconolactone decarboxylase family protein [Marinobacterium sp. xm-d-509]NRQ23324.1 Carboxymuconolactone decarboxylase family protein [Marinobacterium sp. xm-m-312]